MLSCTIKMIFFYYSGLINIIMATIENEINLLYLMLSAINILNFSYIHVYNITIVHMTCHFTLYCMKLA